MQLDGIRYHLKRHCDSLYSVRTSIIIMDVGTTTRIVAGPDEGSIGGKARHQQPDPSLFWPPAHPMWRVPFVLKITWMILGEGYKSGKDFWMLILNSKEQTLQRVMFSKSTCNVLFKLFDVALVFYVIVFGLFANFF